MVDQDDKQRRFAELRRRAEAMFAPQANDDPDAANGLDTGTPAAHALLHELHTHQIELEIQNEELRRVEQELVASRDRYAELYDFAPVGYATLAADGVIREANFTLVEMLGVERRALLNRRFSAFIAADDQDIFYRHFREASTSKGPRTCQLRMLRGAAEPLHVELKSAWFDADGERDARLEIAIIDITERELAEQRNLELQRRVQQAQKLESLGVLAGGIAHDFNNLLMVVLGNSELALRQIPPASAARAKLQEIENATRRAAELANQMLVYSGYGSLEVEPVNAGKLIDEMGHLLEVSVSSKAELKYQIAPDLPVFSGDPTQIRQVILNLIMNAAEAVGDRGGSIVLAAGTMHCDRAYLDRAGATTRIVPGDPLEPGEYTWIEVTDNGPGMSAATLDRIFEPFFTTKFTGRGLGMAVVLGIVRRHRGVLDVHSEVGVGTTFRALFPASGVPSASDVLETRKEPRDDGWRPRGTILLVDDEKPLLMLGQEMLEHLGFGVLTALDGHQALEVFRQSADDIVCALVDLTMPRMDGTEVARELQRLRSDVKIILCSGYHEQHGRGRGRFAVDGFTSFLEKPFSLEELEDRLRAVLEDQASGSEP